jgi:hypothetical protein
VSARLHGSSWVKKRLLNVCWPRKPTPANTNKIVHSSGARRMTLVLNKEFTGFLRSIGCRHDNFEEELPHRSKTK